MKKFFIYCIALLIISIIWESLFSCFFYDIPERYYRDSVTEWVPKPHETVVYSQEGYGWDRYNNVSALGPDVTVPKKDCFRILVFGDSHTQAFQVMPGQKFTNLFGDKLNKLAIRQGKQYQVEVVNLGMNGYSAADYIYYLDYYITRLRPDYIIFQVNHDDFLQALEKRPRYSFLDLTDSRPVLKKDTSKENFLALLLERYGLYNSFALLQGKFSTLDYLVKEILPKFLREIKEFDLKKCMSYPVMAQSTSSPARVNAPKDILPLAGEQMEHIYDDSQNLHKTEQVAQWFFSEVQKRCIPATALLLPYYPTMANGTLVLENNMESRRLAVISHQAETHDVKVINLQRDFLQFYKTNGKFARGFFNSPVGIGHLNIDGHRMTADRLYKKIGGDLP